MSAAVRVRCFAKINTVLRVVGRRPDGYHELDTEFVPLEIHDLLDVEPASTFTLRVVGAPPAEVPVEDNLVLRAARALQAEVGPSRLPGACLVLDKRLPAAAGLGGGSSDAAGALVALPRAHGLDIPWDLLAEIALSVGSDVPYFLAGGRQRGQGRGEILTPLPDRPSVSVLLLKPRRPLATAAVFREHAELAAGEPSRLFGRSLTRRKSGATFPLESWWLSPGWLAHDDLADAAVRLAPEVADLARAAEDIVPEGIVGMTGSGPTVFVLRPRDPAGAERALRRALPAIDIWPTRTLGAGEYADLRFA